MTRKTAILIIIILAALGAASALALNRFISFEKLNEQLPPPYILEEERAIETDLFFAGDIMLSRNVGTKITEAKNPNLPYLSVFEEIKNADISFANLESPFNDSGVRVTQGLVFKAEPNTVEGLVNAGFDVLSTANNHTFDQGKAGLAYTTTWLEQNNITPVGTGTDCHLGVIKEVNEIKFGFLAYSYAAYNDGGKLPDSLVCDWNDPEQIKIDIQNLKTKTDFVIVSSHMGAEYKREPEPENAQRARSTIDAGADLFIGHHPHWIQTIEEYKGKYIFYSLGNFVFDQMWSQDTKEGLAVKVLFKGKKLSRISLLPVVIDNFCCPRWASENETKSILTKINVNYTSPLLVEDGQTTSSWQSVLRKIQTPTNNQTLDNTLPVD
jgi:poly-gamma-glutamate synthesis protein (capsule biosynthesis protein)